LIYAGQINNQVAFLAQKTRRKVIVFLQLPRPSGGEFGGQFWGEWQIRTPPVAASTIAQKRLVARGADWEPHFNCSLAANI
jgi:hypothetical protein